MLLGKTGGGAVLALALALAPGCLRVACTFPWAISNLVATALLVLLGRRYVDLVVGIVIE